MRFLIFFRYELTGAKYVEKLPAGKHSTKGLGMTAPDPASTYTTPEGVAIPMGKGMQSSVSNTSLLYNEYPLCVYECVYYISGQQIAMLSTVCLHLSLYVGPGVTCQLQK